jgi:hypothetical protein
MLAPVGIFSWVGFNGSRQQFVLPGTTWSLHFENFQVV